MGDYSLLPLSMRDRKGIIIFIDYLKNAVIGKRLRIA